MLLKFETEAKSLRPKAKGPKVEAKARGYEAEIEVEANIFALRPVWPRRFNISDLLIVMLHRTPTARSCRNLSVSLNT